VRYRKEAALIGYASVNGTSTLLGKVFQNYREKQPPAAEAHAAEQPAAPSSGSGSDRKEDLRQMLNALKKKR
jgi:uncharacterized membrane protein YebE (DUF533 family)